MSSSKAKPKKIKPAPVDGLSDKDREKLRRAIRQVWSWSTPRKLCIARATNAEGFGTCEKCGKLVAKVYADHINPTGRVDSGFIERMFSPSAQLQALCKKCHDKKTREETKARAKGEV